MRKNIQTLAAATFGLLAIAGAAVAAGDDCRRIPVYSARCFSDRGPSSRCRTIPASQAACFVVHGRLSVANGAPSLRLVPRGSHRILGVFGGDGDAESPTVLPPGLRAAMLPTGPGSLRTVVGDFRVCPLATERTGWMRPVCIASATHVVPHDDP